MGNSDQTLKDGEQFKLTGNVDREVCLDNYTKVLWKDDKVM